MKEFKKAPPELCRQVGIGSAGSGRVDSPADAEELARKLKSLGHEAGKVHVGNGFEDDAEMDALLHSIMIASEKVDFPLYIETHRATITEAMTLSKKEKLLIARTCEKEHLPIVSLVVILVHIRDCDGKVHGDLPPGRGIVKFEPYLQAIKELKIDGVVSIELEYSPDPKRIVEWLTEAYTQTDRLMQLTGLRG